MGTIIIPVILFLFVIMLVTSIKVLLQYERAVIFTLGKFSYVTGPGIIFVIPVIQSAVRVDIRTMVEDVPPQDVISRDNVTVKVSAVIYYSVVDPARSVIQVFNFRRATSELAQTTLRSVLGKHELDDMLSERDKLNHDIQEIIDKQTTNWGIKVQNVEIKHIDLDETMIRAMAKQAEAERMRRAKIIQADGEFQSAQKLVDAGHLLGESDNAMQLRYLSTLQEVGGNGNSVIIPFPIGLLDKVLGLTKKS
jgi:regulator of protease activity HflC (stomatin/prohibitin superfamily)